MWKFSCSIDGLHFQKRKWPLLGKRFKFLLTALNVKMGGFKEPLGAV